MQFKNTLERYGYISILFHWVMALLVVGMLGVGLYMASLPKGPEKGLLIGLHKEFGVIVFVLAVCRILWRWMNPLPALPIPSWERITARLAHWLMLLLIVLMPLSGWLMSSAGGHPVSFFGLFTIPSPILESKMWAHRFNTAHFYMAYALVALLTLHVFAALKHHFIDKDNILKRMFTSR